MAWNKSKICLISKEVDPKTGKTVVHRYYTCKSKAKNKGVTAQSKLTLMKYNPILRRHTKYTETKVKWK